MRRSTDDALADINWSTDDATAERWIQDPVFDDEVGLSEVTFCVIDLETTGTGPAAAITEIGAVKVRGGRRLGEFQTLVNPGLPIPGFITALTGISTTMVRRAPAIDQVFGSLVEFCDGCVMVAHNAGFDMGFLLREAERLGFDWPARTVIDTLSLARRTIPRRDIANYQLSTLAAYFGIDHQPTHRALDDVLATVDVLHALLERVGNQSVTSLADLLAFGHTLSRARRAKRTWADSLPTGPGVYCFIRDAERGHEVLYVGTSRHLRRRVANYFTANETRPRMEEMIALATGVETIDCHTALEAAIVELRLITAHQPPYNRRGKQPRHRWIKLTEEALPRLSITRQPKADGASYAGPFSGRAPAELAVAGLNEAFRLRPCTQRLSLRQAREPCALAEMGACLAPCTLADVPAYQALAVAAAGCLAGDVRPVRQALVARLNTLSEQQRYEEAGEVLERLRAFEQGWRRAARLTALARCRQIVALRRLGDFWEIHVIRFGRLAAAGAARPGDDPARVAALLVGAAATLSPGPDGFPAGRVEETELIAAWLERPGVRLLEVDGTWAWSVHAG